MTSIFKQFFFALHTTKMFSAYEINKRILRHNFMCAFSTLEHSGNPIQLKITPDLHISFYNYEEIKLKKVYPKYGSHFYAPFNFLQLLL